MRNACRLTEVFAREVLAIRFDERGDVDAPILVTFSITSSSQSAHGTGGACEILKAVSCDDARDLGTT